jgi:peptidyl-prolyl cis-trans isomerase C
MSQFVPEFSKAAIALQKGAVTDTPVKSQFGYHVIKMGDVRVPTVPGLEEAKQQVAESVQQRKVAAFREELMKKAKIQ